MASLVKMMERVYWAIPLGNGKTINESDRQEDLDSLSRLRIRTFNSKSTLQLEEYMDLMVIAMAGIFLRSTYQSRKSKENRP